MPQQGSQSSSLPAGYTLDQPVSGLPAGYTLDNQKPVPQSSADQAPKPTFWQSLQPQQMSSFWQALNSPPSQMSRPFDEWLRDHIVNTAGMHLPSDMAGPVAGVLNALTAIPASMVEFGRRNVTPATYLTAGGSQAISPIARATGTISQNVGPLARWLFKSRMGKAMDIIQLLGKGGGAPESEAIPAIRTPSLPPPRPNINMAKSGLSAGPSGFGGPLPPSPALPPLGASRMINVDAPTGPQAFGEPVPPSPALPRLGASRMVNVITPSQVQSFGEPPIPTREEAHILKQMTQSERAQLSKEIADWRASGRGVGIKGIPPDYVKLPPGWKHGDPVPASYNPAQGATPDTADFTDLLKKSISRVKGVKEPQPPPKK